MRERKDYISQSKPIRKMILDYLKLMHIKRLLIPPYENKFVKGFYSRA